MTIATRRRRDNDVLQWDSETTTAATRRRRDEDNRHLRWRSLSNFVYDGKRRRQQRDGRMFDPVRRWRRARRLRRSFPDVTRLPCRFVKLLCKSGRQEGLERGREDHAGQWRAPGRTRDAQLLLFGQRGSE